MRNYSKQLLFFYLCLCLPSEIFTPLNFANDKSVVNNKEKAIQLGRSPFHRGGYSIRFILVGYYATKS